MAAGPTHPRTGLPHITGGGGRSEPLQQAAFALNAKQPEEAQRIAEEILKRDPRNAGALHILGFALLMRGRAQDAVAPLEAAARGRHDPEIETRLALALSQIGRRDDALSRLKRAAKRRPPYPPAFHGLGTLLFAMERCDEAIEVLRGGVKVAPMMPELSTLLGSVYLKQRNFGEAKAAFGQALAISPNSPTRCQEWGWRITLPAKAALRPISFAAVFAAAPTMTRFGCSSAIACCSWASATPATSVSAPPRAAIQSAMAGRWRLLRRPAAVARG